MAYSICHINAYAEVKMPISLTYVKEHNKSQGVVAVLV